jgi:calcium binding protein 39
MFVLQASEDVCKTLQSIKTMLYGTPEQEPQTEHVSQLAMEMYQANMLLTLVQNLAKIEFEVGEPWKVIYHTMV